MTVLGVLGALLGLLAWPIAVIERTRLRATVFLIAWLIHIGMGVVFYLYTLANISDSYGYYYDAGGLYSQGLGVGTSLITFIVQAMKSVVGGTFLDYFMIFQAFGFFGLALLMRMFEEIYLELRVRQPFFIYGLLFLPGLHFWTSSIGKDGPIFTAVCLTLWASMHIRGRWFWMGLGIFLVLIIRPHVALITAAAVSGTILLDRATSTATRIFLVAAAIGGMFLALYTVESTFGIDLTNADSISDYLAAQEQFTTTEDAGATLVRGGFLVKLFSLLFRPFFIDGDGPFGMLASLENAALLIVIATLLWNFRDAVALFRRVTFLRFAVIAGAGMILLLTLMYYNVGLGLRQKTMFVPCLLLLFAVVTGIRKVRRAATMAEHVPAAHIGAIPTTRA